MDLDRWRNTFATLCNKRLQKAGSTLQPYFISFSRASGKNKASVSGGSYEKILSVRHVQSSTTLPDFPSFMMVNAFSNSSAFILCVMTFEI